MPAPPDASTAATADRYVPGRWRTTAEIQWAEQCNRILLDHGEITATRTYAQRHVARWRARRLIALLVDLRLWQRWQLQEHVARHGDGWIWSVRRPG